MHRRLSYANVAATLALVFSMSGGALAAKRYLINSTKQLNPKVLKALKGNNGAIGAAGTQGKEGSAGKDGATGKEGPTGKEGSTGKQGASGATHIVTRYGPRIELETLAGLVSYAACLEGEAVTGGGINLAERAPVNTTYKVLADRPSIKQTLAPGAIFPPPPDGATATGWLAEVENDTGSTFDFRAYVQCASP
jgi:hypothetical protein